MSGGPRQRRRSWLAGVPTYHGRRYCSSCAPCSTVRTSPSRSWRVPIPRPAPGEVLVQVASAGICGSDVQGVATRSPRRSPPLVMGHEFAGTVVEASPEVTPGLVGRRVAVNPQVPCGACLVCRSGRENVCAHRELIGGTRAGGFAEHVSVPIGCVHELTDDLPLGCGRAGRAPRDMRARLAARRRGVAEHRHRARCRSDRVACRATGAPCGGAPSRRQRGRPGAPRVGGRRGRRRDLAGRAR